MQELSDDTVSQEPGEKSVTVKATFKPTIIENLTVDEEVYVYIIAEDNGDRKPLQTTTDGEPKAFSPGNLPEVIAGVHELLIVPTGDTPIDPRTVTGKICSEGEVSH